MFVIMKFSRFLSIYYLPLNVLFNCAKLGQHLMIDIIKQQLTEGSFSDRQSGGRLFLLTTIPTCEDLSFMPYSSPSPEALMA